MLLLAAIVGVAGCGSSTPVTPPGGGIEIGSITITPPSPVGVEKNYHTTLAATAKNKTGLTVSVPFTWRSLNEAIATVDANGRVFGVDTGVTLIVASSLGVNSTPLQVVVTLVGATKIDTFLVKPPGAITPGATPDSIRARITNRIGGPVAGARVKFAVTVGGGTISPAIATTDQFGIASAEWKLGPANGLNTATATLLGEDDVPLKNATPNTTSYSISTYAALKAVDGDSQQGLILSTLPINPSVKVLDSLGKPRPGVPVTFTPTGGGRVALTIVPTGADGSASPGAWTLGDVNGAQTLIAKVDFASITLRAVATGTAVHYTPLQVVAGGLATCAINIDHLVSCWGKEPLVGDSAIDQKSTPTAVRSAQSFFSLAASPSNTGHFCGIATDQSIYCWGTNAIVDTNSVSPVINNAVPTRLPSSLIFSKVAPGNTHNCGLTTDQKVYCWGDDSQGQLGDQKTKERFTPALVSGSFVFSDLTSGYSHSCALTPTGGAFCWGANTSGQLGNGTTNGFSSPTAVQTPVSFQRISAGASFTCGLTTTGAVMCWGNLGTGLTTVVTPRAYAATLPVFTSLSVGGFHACALTADGSAYCWGNNQVGQLGDSTTTERLAPTPVVTTIKFKSISAGYGHTCGTALDNAVACWGDNSTGALGDSISSTRVTPKYVVLSVTP